MDMAVIGDEMSKYKSVYDPGDRTSDRGRRIKMAAMDYGIFRGNNIMDRGRSLIAVECMSQFRWMTKDIMNLQDHAWGQQDTLVIELVKVRFRGYPAGVAQVVISTNTKCIDVVHLAAAVVELKNLPLFFANDPVFRPGLDGRHGGEALVVDVGPRNSMFGAHGAPYEVICQRLDWHKSRLTTRCLPGHLMGSKSPGE